MGFTVTTPLVAPDPPLRVCAATDSARVARFDNIGFVPVYFGDASVTVGVGIELWPGDEPFMYDQGDELYAVANNGQIAIDERRP